jgi:hypothetical protein
MPRPGEIPLANSNGSTLRLSDGSIDHNVAGCPLKAIECPLPSELPVPMACPGRSTRYTIRLWPEG